MGRLIAVLVRRPCTHDTRSEETDRSRPPHYVMGNVPPKEAFNRIKLVFTQIVETPMEYSQVYTKSKGKYNIYIERFPSVVAKTQFWLASLIMKKTSASSLAIIGPSGCCTHLINY